MKKLSQWHSGDVKPVHVGVYQRKIFGAIVYGKWTGKIWNCSASTAKEADKHKKASYYLNPRYEWRGLTK